MTSTSERTPRTDARFFPGWIVVGAAFVLLMANSGFIFYGQAVYLDALTDERGFSTGAASLGQSLVFVVGGLVGPRVGKLITDRDVRVVVLGGLITSWVAVVLLGRVEELWQLYGVNVLLGVGFSAAGLVPATTVVTRWFETRRSVALAIASTGLSVGGLTFTQLVAWWIRRDGLELATPWLVVVWAACTLPVVPLLWPTPEHRGVLASGAVAGSVAMGVAYEIAVRSRFFTMVTAGYVLVLGMQVGGITHLVKLGNERAGDGTGGRLIAGLTIASVVARLIGGVVADKQPLVRLAVGFAATQALALALLSQVESGLLLVLCAILFGATIGNILMLQPLLFADAMGARDYARVFALNQLIVVAGVALGPFLLGALHDATSYRLSYLVGAVLCAVGTVLLSRAGSTQAARAELDTERPAQA
ncbi:MAG TPA: MFS transporter [Acidimicrobiaceae bacterium]|nr:MFS transporter [Acidimicrobiaceae bacterium]